MRTISSLPVVGCLLLPRKVQVEASVAPGKIPAPNNAFAFAVTRQSGIVFLGNAAPGFGVKPVQPPAAAKAAILAGWTTESGSPFWMVLGSTTPVPAPLASG